MRWCQNKYQVPGTIHNIYQWKTKEEWFQAGQDEPSRTMQWKRGITLLFAALQVMNNGFIRMLHLEMKLKKTEPEQLS